MTAIEAIETIMSNTETSLGELAEYSDLGSKSNICQMLTRKDLKVGTFVKMLETMGYQLVVRNEDDEDELVIDYDV
jgi:antitoxin component HigA of HigAB toxin-antitoxin module